MATWLSFLDEYNGRTFFMQEHWLESEPLVLYTNAAVSKGYGAIFDSHWLYGEWPDKWKSFNIFFLELFPIALALRVWGYQMQNKHVSFYTDNMLTCLLTF